MWFVWFNHGTFNHKDIWKIVIRSAAGTIRIRYGSCRYDTYSIRVLSIRYLFDTGLADTIPIRYGSCRYDTYSIRVLPIRYVFDTIHRTLHDLRYQNQEFWISTTKLMVWVDLYRRCNTITPYIENSNLIFRSITF